MDISSTLQNLSSNLSVEERTAIKNDLSFYLNHLLINDFSALVQILYRVDVSEKKLKTVLAENTEADAGDLLAELIIERQQQKLLSKNSTSFSTDIPDEERW